MYAGSENSGEAVPMLSLYCLPMLKVSKSHSLARYFDNVSKEDNGCSILNGKVINVQKQMLKSASTFI